MNLVLQKSFDTSMKDDKEDSEDYVGQMFKSLKRTLISGSVVQMSQSHYKSIRSRLQQRAQSFKNINQLIRRPSMPARMSSSELRLHRDRLFSSGSEIRQQRQRRLDNIDPKFTSQSGLCSSSELSTSQGTSVSIQHLQQCRKTSTGSTGSIMSPLLLSQSQHCAHFHYEFTELHDIGLELIRSVSRDSKVFSIRVASNKRTWLVFRSYEQLAMLDKQIHVCVFDRNHSKLPVVPQEENVHTPNGRSLQDCVQSLLSSYLSRLSTLLSPVVTCGPVLCWLELDNRGNRLQGSIEDAKEESKEESAINTPAVAAAYAVRRYVKQAADEISFEVGDMISVIDLPSAQESHWWRGKRGFEVGFFPCDAVNLIEGAAPKTPVNISFEENNETKPVLRKRGKLISFLRSFILSRPARGKLKRSGILRERVFGCDLAEHLFNTNQDVPRILRACSEFIEAVGLVDGVYRLSGVASTIQRLRLSFDEDRVPDLRGDKSILADVHSVSSLLKMYFRELPNPVCTFHLYEQFVNAARAPENERLVLMRKVVQQLPPPNYRTLEYLSRHLYRVSLHGSETGMTARNVSIVWAPNLLRSKALEVGGVAALQGVGVQAVVTEFLIRYCELIFSPCGPKPEQKGEKEDKVDNKEEKDDSPINEVERKRRQRPKSLAVSTPTSRLESKLNNMHCLPIVNDVSEHKMDTESTMLPGTVLETRPSKLISVGPNMSATQFHTVLDVRRKSSAKQRRPTLDFKFIFKTHNNNNNNNNKKESNNKDGQMSNKVQVMEEPPTKEEMEVAPAPKSTANSIVKPIDTETNSNLKSSRNSQDSLQSTNSALRPAKSAESLRQSNSKESTSSKSTKTSSNSSKLSSTTSSKSSYDKNSNESEEIDHFESLDEVLVLESTEKSSSSLSPKFNKRKLEKSSSPQIAQQNKQFKSGGAIGEMGNALVLSPSINFIDAVNDDDVFQQDQLTANIANSDKNAVMDQVVVAAEIHHYNPHRHSLSNPHSNQERKFEKQGKMGEDRCVDGLAEEVERMEVDQIVELDNKAEKLKSVKAGDMTMDCYDTSVESGHFNNNRVFNVDDSFEALKSESNINTDSADVKNDSILTEEDDADKKTIQLRKKDSTEMSETYKDSRNEKTSTSPSPWPRRTSFTTATTTTTTTTTTATATATTTPTTSSRHTRVSRSEEPPVSKPRVSILKPTHSLDFDLINPGSNLSEEKSKIESSKFAPEISSTRFRASSSGSLQQRNLFLIDKNDNLTQDSDRLRRRNSIHNVPYVDVNDPRTRERIERYKEERRTRLRATYRMENYLGNNKEINKKGNFENNCNNNVANSKTKSLDSSSASVPLRKMHVGCLEKRSLPNNNRVEFDLQMDKTTNNAKSSSIKTVSSTTSSALIEKTTDTLNRAIPQTFVSRQSWSASNTSTSSRPSSSHRATTKSLNNKEYKTNIGATTNSSLRSKSVIEDKSDKMEEKSKDEDDVNVKERAARFSAPSFSSDAKLTSSKKKSSDHMKHADHNESKDNNASKRSEHDSRIRNMAAFFERKTSL